MSVNDVRESRRGWYLGYRRTQQQCTWTREDAARTLTNPLPSFMLLSLHRHAGLTYTAVLKYIPELEKEW